MDHDEKEISSPLSTKIYPWRAEEIVLENKLDYALLSLLVK
jgi:hypothetical protein